MINNSPYYDGFEGIGLDDERHVEIVLLGYNSLTKEIVLEACRVCHFANFKGNPVNKTVITIVTDMKDTSTIQSEWVIYNADFMDIEIQFRNGNIEDFNLLKDEREKDHKVIATFIDTTVIKKEVTLNPDEHALGVQLTYHPVIGVSNDVLALAKRFYEYKNVKKKQSWEDKATRDYYISLAKHWQTRFRTLGWNSISPNSDKIKEVFGENTTKENQKLKDIFAQVEHMRWCVKSIQEGFFPLKDEISQERKFDKLEKENYREQKMHVDLCSWEVLSMRDKDAQQTDYEQNKIVFCLCGNISLKSNCFCPCVANNKNLILFILLALLLFWYVSRDCEVNINWDVICTILGYFSVAFACIYLYMYAFIRPTFDRFLAETRKLSISLAMLCIVGIPCAIALFARHNGIQQYDFFYDQRMYSPNDTAYINNVVSEEAQTPSLFWSVFYHFQGASSQHMAGTPQGRSWAFVVGLLGTFLLSGLLLTLFIGYFERYVDRWETGKREYNFKFNKFLAIIGWHDCVPEMIRQALLKYSDAEYIVVMTNQDIAYVRNQLHSFLSKQEISKVIVYQGECVSRIDIHKLRVWRDTLQAVYVVGEQSRDGEMFASNDSHNLECLSLIMSERQNNSGAESLLPCYIMFEHHSTYTSFVQTDTAAVLKKYIELTPFSFYEMWAQKALSSVPLRSGNTKQDYFWPIDQKLADPIVGQDFNHRSMKECIGWDSDKHVHLVIIGMSRMGMALAEEAALSLHYPNFVREEIREELLLSLNPEGKVSSQKDKLRTRITFIDPDVETQMALFHNRNHELFELAKWSYKDLSGGGGFNKCVNKLNGLYGSSVEEPKFAYEHLREPKLKDSNFIDIEWDFIKGRVEDSAVRQFLIDSANEDSSFMTIAVCLPKDEHSVSSAAYLPREVLDHVLQVLVYQRHGRKMVEQLSGPDEIFKSHLRYWKLKPFGMLSECFDQDIIDSRMAKIVHLYKDQRNGPVLPAGTILDTSRMEWDSSEFLQKWSSKYSEHSWMTVFRSMHFDFNIENRELFTRLFVPEVDFETEGNLNDKINEVESNNRFSTTNLVRSVRGRVEHNRWVMERLLHLKQVPLSDVQYEYFDSQLHKCENDGFIYSSLSDVVCYDYKSEEDKAIHRDYNAAKGARKKQLKDKTAFNPHLDICSYWKLRHRDFESLEYDVNRFKRILKHYERFFE